MKKKRKKILILVIILVFIQQCSMINLIPSFVLNKSDYRYLSEGVSSENYTIEKISDAGYSIITYDTINNYFIVDTNFYQIKISAEGDSITSIKSGFLPYKTHFVFADSTAHDFSKQKVEAEPFYQIINSQEEKMEKDDWISLFEAYYNKASTVIYSNDELIYLKINEGWVALHMPIGYFLGGNYFSERTFENYPGKYAKYNKLIFLKDNKSNTYSDWLSHSGSVLDKLYPDERLKLYTYPEKALDYPNDKIEKISFHKTDVSETVTYTSIIAQFQGIGYYKLKKENEYVRFKENADKYPFLFFSSDGYLNHYSVPEKFKTKTNVSFIVYSYPSNQNESESQGIYIVKKK